MEVKIQFATIKNLRDIQDLNHQLCIKENKEFDATINPDYPVQKQGEEYFKDRNPKLEPKHEYEVKKWIQYFSLQPGDKVYVHGCGYGQRLHWFLELGMDAWGMEVSEYAMRHAYGKAFGKGRSSVEESFKNWWNSCHFL